MALRVAVQYMARVNPEVADRAVDVAYGHEPNEQRKTHGLKSVQHLFSAGAQFLKRFAPPRLLPRGRCSMSLALQIRFLRGSQHSGVSPTALASPSMEECSGHHYQTKPGGEAGGTQTVSGPASWQLVLLASLIA